MDVRLKFRLDQIIELALAIKDEELARDKIRREFKVGTCQKEKNEVKRQFCENPTKEGNEMPNLTDAKIRFYRGVWEIRYRKNGYDKSFSAKRQCDALEKFRIFKETIKKENLKHKNTKSPKVNGILFGEYLKEVLELKRPLIKDTSFSTYEKLSNEYLLPNFANIPINAIKPAEIQKIINEIYERGKTRQIQSLKYVAGFIFNNALKNGIIKINPIDSVIFPKHYRRNGDRLTDEEVENFKLAIKGKPYELVFLLMLYSGARRAEVISFDIKQIDFEKNTFKIQCAKVKGKREKIYRELPIFPKLKPILLEIVKNGGFKKYYNNSISRAFKRIEPNHHLNELRHTFISIAKEKGVNPELVAFWVGHNFEGVKRGAVTSKVYTHFSFEFQQSEALKLL